jgi:hypothetical protein
MPRKSVLVARPVGATADGATSVGTTPVGTTPDGPAPDAGQDEGEERRS